MQLLLWLENTQLAVWISESDWAYPIILTCHALGMACVVGAVLMFDLRILGYADGIPLSALRLWLRIAAAGFAVNLLSGALLFIAAASQFVGNPAFLLKLLLIAAGGTCTQLLSTRLELSAAPSVITNRQRVLAGASILFWCSAIVAGRLIAYV